MQLAAPSGRPGSAALACALALAGCEVPPSPESSTPAEQIVAPASHPEPDPLMSVAPDPVRGESLGEFRFTMYYVAQEEMSGAPDITSGDPDKSPEALYGPKDCTTPIAVVSKAFARTLDLQGTGKLRDGRVLNTAGLCKCPHSPCYAQIQDAWAMGPQGKLSPFRSVAVDTRMVKLGSVLYIPELDGKRMPGRAPWGGYVHDGCVIAQDRGGGIRNHEIDLFVAKKAYSNALDHRHRMKKVTVHAGAGWCERTGGGKVRKISTM